VPLIQNYEYNISSREFLRKGPLDCGCNSDQRVTDAQLVGNDASMIVGTARTEHTLMAFSGKGDRSEATLIP
jgi:hypothetical protein